MTPGIWITLTICTTVLLVVMIGAVSGGGKK